MISARWSRLPGWRQVPKRYDGVNGSGKSSRMGPSASNRLSGAHSFFERRPIRRLPVARSKVGTSQPVTRHMSGRVSKSAALGPSLRSRSMIGAAEWRKQKRLSPPLPSRTMYFSSSAEPSASNASIAVQKPFATGPWKAGGGTDGGTVTGRIINPPCEIRTQIFGK